jgi:hypothetical protein
LACLQDGFDRRRLLIGSISCEIPHIQKSGTLETDIDEGCLHTWHDPNDSTEIKITDTGSLVCVLNFKIDNLIALGLGNPSETSQT